MTKIASIGLGIPSYELEQETVKDLVKHIFLDEKRLVNRLLTIFENAAIESRQFVVHPDWFQLDHDFKVRNDLYIKHALELSLKAIEDCLIHPDFLQQPIPFSTIDHIIFVSSTGVATPTMDVHIMNRKPFKETISRMPLWGLGCAGGAIGLAHAHRILQAQTTKNVLLICCELCSLTFQKDDLRKSNIVGTALFGDGASAALLVGKQSPLNKFIKSKSVPVIKRTSSYTIKDTENVMGWNIHTNGFEVIFSKRIPKLVHTLFKPHLENFLEESQLKNDDIDSFVAHPGGRKVLEAMESSCSIASAKLRYSYEVLKNHGNMSSPTVLYVLQKWMKDLQTKQKSVLSALGPGFSSELLLLEWS
ncbi:MAG TPA: 3-oxoacyl-[acyl-carrier-protein] synthase III C-terminal domain-containing protein [Cerasibacillus sp.]|uniref:type III polyketide synthase n=1 Tax=Cerasibacillus sp. TaxID=2498711 RepID=UPI002F419EC7